jgi:hypothetical protein
LTTDDGNSSFQDVGFHGLDSPAIVLRESVGERNMALGILVSVYLTEGHTTFATYIGRVRVAREGSEVDKIWKLGELSQRMNSDTILGENMKYQTWHIR